MAQNSTHYFMISVGQKPWRSLAGPSASGSFTKLQSKCCQWSPLKAQLGKDLLSKPFPQVVGRIQFLKGCWTEVISFLLTTAQRPPSASCHVGLSKITICFIKTSCGKSAYKTKILTFNLRIDTSSLCHILFITSKSLDSVHTQGKRVTYGHDCQKVDITRGPFKKVAYYTQHDHKSKHLLL